MNKWILVFVSIGTISKLWSYEVHHLIRPSSTIETMALQNSCLTLNARNVSISCNPAMFGDLQPPTIISGALFGKSDGKSVDNTKTLIFEEIQEPFLRDLFTKNNFNSFTFNSRLEFLAPYFSLSYSPYYVVADFLVTNPAFPEIALVLLKRRTLTASSGFSLADFFQFEGVDLSIGGTSNFITEESYLGSFGLIELATTRVNNLIRFEKYNAITLDLTSRFAFHDNVWFPELGLAIRNLFSPFDREENRIKSAKELGPTHLREAYNEAEIGKNWKTDWGGLFVATHFVSNNIDEFPLRRPSLVGRYGLGPFAISGGLSQYFQTSGLHFNSKTSGIGIVFTREKEILGFNTDPEKSVYLSLEGKLQ